MPAKMKGVLHMEVKMNAAGRKTLGKALAEITGAKATYKGAPGFACEIDCFTVTAKDSITLGRHADSTAVEQVLDALARRGFKADSIE